MIFPLMFSWLGKIYMCIYYLSADMAGDLGVEGKWEGKIGKILGKTREAVH